MKGQANRRVPDLSFFKEIQEQSRINVMEVVRLARALEQVILQEDLKGFERWVQKNPSCLFQKIRPLDEAENYIDGSNCAWDVLGLMPESFVFEAGRIWGNSWGKLGEDKDIPFIKKLVTIALESSFSARGHAIVFACGVAANENLGKFREWFQKEGDAKNWETLEFGATEWKIWGEKWAQRIHFKEMACSWLLVQATIRGAEGRDQEFEYLLQEAKKMGKTSRGWVAIALEEAQEYFENEALLRESIDQHSEMNEVLKQKAMEYTKESLKKVEEFCSKACLEGPSSWSKEAKGALAPVVWARIESLLLKAVSKSKEPSSKSRVQRL